MAAHHRRELLDRVDPQRGGVTALARVERRELVGADATTGTPSVSSTSRVSPMSRIDFTPALITVTLVWPSSVRSAEMSKLCSAPR